MRYALVVLSLLLLAEAASAQRRGDLRFAKQGDTALLIGVSGLSAIRLEPALGGIGVRYRLADRTVVGASLGLNVQTRDDETDGDRRNGDRGLDQSNTVASLWLEQHLGRPRRTVSPFVAAGVQASAGSTESTSQDSFRPCPLTEDCAVQSVSQTTESETLSIAGGLAVGAEVRIVRGVTLGGAYTVGVRYTQVDAQNVREQLGQEPEVNVFESQGLSVGTGTTQLSLSVYF